MDYLAEKRGKNVQTFKFLTKNKEKKGKNFLIFDQKSWTNPTKKMQIFRLLKSIF